MSGLPLVSVIVPAYNAARFLGDTLDSVLAQTHRNIEILVVDDGSSDETAEIAEAFARKDARVRWWRQPNAGVGAARNAAIAEAKGCFIAPIDADDVWHPGKIAAQVRAMELGGEEIGFVYCWSRVIDAGGRLVHLLPSCAASGRVLRRHVFRNFLHNASVPLFRAAALAEVGGYATREEQGGAQGCEDWDLTLRVAEKFQVRVVPEYLVDYREVIGGMSFGGTGMAASFAWLQAGLRRRNPHVAPRLHRWAGGFFHLYLARKCHEQGRAKEALSHLKTAFIVDPAVAVTPLFFRVLGGSGRRFLWPARYARRSGEPTKGRGTRRIGVPQLWSLFACVEHLRWTRLTAEEEPV